MMSSRGVKAVLLVLCVCLLVLVLVPFSAQAKVKSETIFIETTGFEYTLQLKSTEKVYWEYSATDPYGDPMNVDFSIKDSDGDVLASAAGKSSDSGNAVVPKQDTYVFTWIPEEPGNLAYTITYEPLTKDEVDGGMCCTAVMIGCVLVLVSACVGYVLRRRG